MPDAPTALADLEDLLARSSEHRVPRLDRMRTDYAGATSATRAASVLVLFGMVEGELSVLLTQRAAEMRKHAGQVAFPGGAQDPEDADVVAAAVREAEEETGLLAEDYRILGTLPPIPVAVSGFLVTPVLAWWDSPRPLAPVDAAETARVFTVPVRELADGDLRVRTVLRRDRHVFKGPGWQVREALVWGFTGFVLEAILEELGWISPHTPQRTVDPLG